jgi:hypothetical protein
MHGPLLILIFVGTSVVIGIISMLIAVKKGHPAIVGFLLGFLFNVFGLLVVLIMKRADQVAAPPIPPPPPPSGIS